jgi:hypothetical protein
VVEVKYKAVILIFVVGLITACGSRIIRTFSMFPDEDFSEHEVAIIEHGSDTPGGAASIAKITEIDFAVKQYSKGWIKVIYHYEDYDYFRDIGSFTLKPGTYSITYVGGNAFLDFSTELTDTVTLKGGHRYAVKHETCYYFCGGPFGTRWAKMWIEDKMTKEIIAGGQKYPENY